MIYFTVFTVLGSGGGLGGGGGLAGGPGPGEKMVVQQTLNLY